MKAFPKVVPLAGAVEKSVSGSRSVAAAQDQIVAASAIEDVETEAAVDDVGAGKLRRLRARARTSLCR